LKNPRTRVYGLVHHLPIHPLEVEGEARAPAVRADP
jgi:hypothetical protein